VNHDYLSTGIVRLYDAMRLTDLFEPENPSRLDIEPAGRVIRSDLLQGNVRERKGRPNTERPPRNADVLHGYFHARVRGATDRTVPIDRCRLISRIGGPAIAIPLHCDVLRELAVPPASKHPEGRYPPWSTNNQLPKTRCDRVRGGC
jgi:hypothetical protein